jgi:hypothetical protein
MQGGIEIKHLSREQKLIMMEAIWVDLSKDDESVESPAWHQKALLETERLRCEGREKVHDWQDAKKALRSRFK